VPELRWMIVGSLALVVVLQLWHRTLGACAAVVWSSTLFLYGIWSFGQGLEMTFLAIPVPLWLFVGAMGGMLGYHIWAFVRVLRA
jgi:hypothetical protein